MLYVCFQYSTQDFLQWADWSWKVGQFDFLRSVELKGLDTAGDNSDKYVQTQAF